MEPWRHLADAQLNTLWRSCDRALLAIERDVSLLVRCCPTNAASEQQRLLASWRAGSPVQPRWVYAPSVSLERAAHALQRICTALPDDPISRLYLGRAEELELERTMATLVGRAELREQATRRYRITDADSVSAADTLAEEWSALAVSVPTALVASDDESDPNSLYALMCRAVGELCIPFRVALSDSLSAVAATGESVIAVARGRSLGAQRARRIVAHEVYGHALPRVRASALSLGLFQVGSSFGNDVQEGWALAMEIEHGLMDDERRRELGLRHLAAADMAAGADWVETTRSLIARGAELTFAVELSARAHRGGGLGRERVYLPAWCQVNAALTNEPSFADWLGAGRVSVEAARLLRELRSTWEQ